jgi:hypothetical protein
VQDFITTGSGAEFFSIRFQLREKAFKFISHRNFQLNLTPPIITFSDLQVNRSLTGNTHSTCNQLFHRFMMTFSEAGS